MKKIVIGATGFIGSAIVRELLKQGHEIRVLARKTSSLENVTGLDVEIVYGDICDGASIKAALTGCDTLYFTAAKFTHWAPKPKEIYEVNVEGTRTALAAAREAALEKVVYTSTNNAIGASGRTPADEQASFNYWQAGDHYSMSKYIAGNEARMFAMKGLPLVIVNPTLVIGVNDITPTPSGRVIIDVANGKLPCYMDGGVNIVDVEDVAKGHILAATRGKVGERYLLGNTNVTIKEYLTLIAGIADAPVPKIKLPYPLALLGGHVLEGFAYVTKHPPRSPPARSESQK